MQMFTEYLSEFTAFSIFLRLFLAVVFGGVIGFERMLKRRSAGLRTFALVCVGAALAMITNEYLFLQYNMNGDPGRMAAQVISGVGFLGAGTIILNGKKVKGLTTAASLWATAAVGIAIGSGFFVGAFLGFFIIFIATTLMLKFEEKVERVSKFIEVYVEIKKENDLFEIVNYISENDFSLASVEKADKSEKKKFKGTNSLHIGIKLKKRTEHEEVISQINLLETVEYAEEVKEKI